MSFEVLKQRNNGGGENLNYFHYVTFNLKKKIHMKFI